MALALLLTVAQNLTTFPIRACKRSGEGCATAGSPRRGRMKKVGVAHMTSHYMLQSAIVLQKGARGLAWEEEGR